MYTRCRIRLKTHTYYKGLLVVSLLTFSCIASAGQYDKAINKALDAAYRQTGLRSIVSKKAKRLEKKYIPKPVSEVSGWAIWVHKVIKDGNVTYKWTF